MHWKLKATIQNTISLLPSETSYQAYYWLQRRYGGLRRVNPSSRLVAGIETWKRILGQNHSPLGKVFFEVGTGRVPLAPLSYWLMGAGRTITIDLNPYLKEELIFEHLRYISENEQEILTLFGSLVDRTRFDDLMKLARSQKLSVAKFLDLCQITYIAPGDAAHTNLPKQHIDFHTSYTVFEHIPPNVLVDILKEGNRIIKENGLFVHRIDYSDHFSHSDKNISAINFLQFSDDAWAKYAANRYMYMNRLRHDDALHLFESSGHTINSTEPTVDKRSEDLLRVQGVGLDKRFSSKPKEILAISGSWIVTEKNG